MLRDLSDFIGQLPVRVVGVARGQELIAQSQGVIPLLVLIQRGPCISVCSCSGVSVKNGVVVDVLYVYLQGAIFCADLVCTATAVFNTEVNTDDLFVLLVGLSCVSQQVTISVRNAVACWIA